MPTKKAVVKTTRSAKTVSKKTAPKAAPQKVSEVLPSEVLPTKKPKKHVKIQTAEGWKRSMLLRKNKAVKTAK